MNYPQNRKSRNRNIFSALFIALILLMLFYFRGGIFSGLSYVANITFRPVLSLGGKLWTIPAYFASKSALERDNENLRMQLAESEAKKINYAAVLAENGKIKEILGRKNEKIPMILAAILSKPNQSPYDTFLIDVGANQGLETGDVVFAFGDVPIGRVGEVYPSSAKVILFSNPGDTTEAVFSDKNTFVEVLGRGGGNFEIVMPRDFELKVGELILLPALEANVLAVVRTIISDPRDAFVKALLTSPVNIFELRFVEVRK